MDNKIQSFEQLVVWQESQNLAVQVYKLTINFPQSEQYGITSQLRRAVTSVSANISEGFGRNSIKDKLQFYAVANGSLLETKNFLYLSQRLEYIDIDGLTEILLQVTSCQKLLNAYVRGHKQHE